jgi:uncharacterized protein YdeI (YjbR/CyaY-like superfamily)
MSQNADEMRRYRGGVASKLDDAERVHVETAAEWRSWLEENAGRGEGVWLVSWKKASGRPAMSYDEAVTEALAFGWVDSVPRKLDDDRTMLYYAPRKPGSGWARPNKVRVARLEAEGRMAPAGAAAVASAKADGSWSKLDDVEDLVVPPDLADALAAHPPAADEWEAFPRSAKRGILEWIVQAKKPETRAKRVAETAEMAARGERANQWPRTSRKPVDRSSSRQRPS